MDQKRMALILLSFLALALFPALAAGAEPMDDQTENLFPFADDLVIQGVTNRHDFYFELTPSRVLSEGSYLQLTFSHSGTLLPDKSTLTVLLDDKPLGSLFLNRSNEKPTGWRADLSELALEPGFHKLSFVSHMEVSADLCIDQNNSANWLILHKESLLHLRFQKAYEQADFAYYPSPFLEKGSLQPLQTLFVVPDSPNEEQLKAFGELAGFFSSQVPANRLSFQVFKESELNGEMRKENMIWIGSESQWGTLGKQLAERGSKDGMMKLSVSPWDSQSTVLSINGTDQEIAAAVRQLVTPEYYAQLSGRTYEISKLGEQAGISGGLVGEDADLTLEELGYGDLVVESPIAGTARIAFALPAEADPARPGHLKLHFKHAKSLNFAESLVTVKVNGFPTASRYLNEESSDFGTLDLEIPPDRMANRNLIVDVSFQFESAEGICSGGTQIGHWAVISKHSVFSFETRPNDSMQLEQLPYPFVIRQAWAPTEFLLPASPSSEEMSLFVTVCGMMGRQAAQSPADGDTFTVRLDDNPADAAGKNLIYIGLAEHIPEAVSASADFPVRYENGEFLPANASIPLLPHAGQGYLMAMIPSPYSEKHQVLVIAGANRDVLRKANLQFADPEIRAKITGKSAVIDGLDRVHTLQASVLPADDPSWSEKASEWLDMDGNPVIARFWFAGVFIVVLGAVGVLLWMTRKRSR